MAEDANFKQKARLRSGDAKDPALGPGWATFVNNEKYFNHLAKQVDHDEVILLATLLPMPPYCLSRRLAIVWGFRPSGTPTASSRGDSGLPGLAR